MSGALAVREEQTYWDEHQQAALQQAGIEEDVTEPELRGFLHLCQRTGLDPFSRQAYLIGRWDARKGRKVYTPQTSIDGYRIVAQRTSERTRTPLAYDDTLWCGPDGQWTDVWLSAEPPAAAKVTVRRGGNAFSAVALWHEYCPTTRDGKPQGLWSRMPAVMVAKCAEALALRKAFPNDLSGVYTTDEMAQAPAQQPAQTVEAPQQPRAIGPAQEVVALNDVAANEWTRGINAASDRDGVNRLWAEAREAGQLDATFPDGSSVRQALIGRAEVLRSEAEQAPAGEPDDTVPEDGQQEQLAVAS